MKPGASPQRLLLSALILLLVVGLIVGGVFLLERAENTRDADLLKQKAEKLSRTLWTDENTIAIDGDTLGFDHRIETFLFVGTDFSGGQQIFNSSLKRQPMADFLLLMVLDHTNNSIGYLQIDRNTVTSVTALDENGKIVGAGDMQICIAHWYGGTQEMAADNLLKAVREYLGDLENIDGYYIINLKDIERLNNAVGGVDITIEEDLTDADPAFTKGATLHLTDEQAKHYLQSRMNVSDGTNVARMSRQRNYMNSLFASVRQRCLDDPQFAVSLWNTMRSAAFTNMNGNDFSRIAQKLMKGNSLGIRTVEGETKEGYLAGDDEPHEEFYPSLDSLKAQLTELFSLVPAEEAATAEAEEDDEEDEDDASGAEDGDFIPAVEGAPEIMSSGSSDENEDDEAGLNPDDEEEDEDEEDEEEPPAEDVRKSPEPEQPEKDKGGEDQA